MRAAGATCDKTGLSSIEGHVHTCIGKHTPRDDTHFCGVCRKRWWSK